MYPGLRLRFAAASPGLLTPRPVVAARAPVPLFLLSFVALVVSSLMPLYQDEIPEVLNRVHGDQVAVVGGLRAVVA